MRKKSERVVKLLEKGPLLKEERDRARKVTRGIRGFGSFDHIKSLEWSGVGQTPDLFRKCNSHYEADSERGDGVDDVKESSSSDEEVSCVKAKIELRNEDHPFSEIEHQEMESVLLLGQS